MSIEAITAVLDHSPQKRSKLLLLIVMANYADDQGIAWPAIETIAKRMRSERRAVQKMLRQLEESGDLIPLDPKEVAHLKHLKKLTTNPYMIGAMRTTSRGAVNRPPLKKLQGRSTDRPGGGQPTARGAVNRPPNPSNNRQTKRQSRTASTDAEQTQKADPPKMPTNAEAVAWWADVASECGLQKIISITDVRRKHFKKRCEEGFWMMRAMLAEEIKASKFLKGMAKPRHDGQKAFKITFDWLITNDNNWVKVIEGRYRDQKEEQAIAKEAW